MTLTNAAGVTFKAIGISALLRITLATGERWLLGCERCGTTCMHEAKCQCCQRYGVRTSGGSRALYPDDGKGHQLLMRLSVFQAKCAERGIAPIGQAGLVHPHPSAP